MPYAKKSPQSKIDGELRHNWKNINQKLPGGIEKRKNKEERQP